MQVKSLSPTEISELIKERIAHFDLKPEVRSEGTIISVKDGIVRLHGLSDVMQGEMLEFIKTNDEKGDDTKAGQSSGASTFGLALNLERDSVDAVVLGNTENLSEGQTAKCTGRILEVPVGEALLGRVVDALGNPIDGKGAIE